MRKLSESRKIEENKQIEEIKKNRGKYRFLIGTKLTKADFD